MEMTKIPERSTNGAEQTGPHASGRLPQATFHPKAPLPAFLQAWCRLILVTWKDLHPNLLPGNLLTVLYGK